MNQSVLPGFEFLLMVTKEIMQEYSEDYARLVSSLQEYAARGILGEAM